MASRLAAIVVTLVLVVASGVARSVSYLCLMDGQVRSACCCNKAQAERAEADGPKVERQGCCEVRVSEATQAPATTKEVLQNDRLPVELALASHPPTLDVPRLTSRDLLPGIGARAPPHGMGPPIFVRNCRYLI